MVHYKLSDESRYSHALFNVTSNNIIYNFPVLDSAIQTEIKKRIRSTSTPAYSAHTALSIFV